MLTFDFRNRYRNEREFNYFRHSIFASTKIIPSFLPFLPSIEIPLQNLHPPTAYLSGARSIGIRNADDSDLSISLDFFLVFALIT